MVLGELRTDFFRHYGHGRDASLPRDRGNRLLDTFD